MELFKQHYGYTFNLQLFADGGDGGDGGDSGGATSGENNAAAAGQDTGAENAAAAGQVQTIDRNAEFERLIKEDYKDLYDKRVQDIVQARLKNSKETVAKYNAAAPLLSRLAQRYGVDDGDYDGIGRAMDADDPEIERLAYETNTPKDVLLEMQAIKRQNETLQAQIESQRTQEETDRIYGEWMHQADEARALYPDLDLAAEMANESFANLLLSGIDVGTAYLVTHKDDILPAVISRSVREAETKVTNRVAANAARPAENGMNNNAASVTKVDISKLSAKEMEDINRRVMAGERITLR